ncbi:transcription elongation factor A N-terminal and central domain-containing protein-like [Denticeps clupeoides]|uniref:transcription elongation factor A N-terminal and central domain-containing protein-like n=1 Tax=Denticeps clupeoides TaxID=299321 RepID=UPI0010A562C8|nr:transcription elongation factor A N-terminal and central domain-containing protein-like [Denticeps clupeoides]XP_028825107.1 transcription elongation factor A N-terminal and central domain-containing protein-like [Denticeps clupeoides]
MDTTELTRLSRQLEKLHEDCDYGDIVSLLSPLATCHVTLEQLQDTDIGRVLHRLVRSCPNTGVQRHAKALLSCWRKRHTQRLRRRSSDDVTSCLVHAGSESTGGADEEALQKQDSTSETHTSAIREKCVELLASAVDPEGSEENPTLARNIESHVYSLHKSNVTRYKSCVRSKVANLRNPKCAHLRRTLLAGTLAPEAFAAMSAAEMAGPELRRLRDVYTAEAIDEHQLPRGVEGTPTRRLRCRRCRGADCRVSQVSRGTLFLPAWVRQGSPDQDAMTFVTCSACGQQWYQSGWVCF